MKKNLLLLTIITLIGFAFQACQSDGETLPETTSTAVEAKADAPPRAGQVRSNIEQRVAKYKPYKLHLPKGWLIKESYKNGGIKAYGPHSEKRPSQYRESIIVNPFKRGRVLYNKETEEMEQLPADLEEFFTNYQKDLPNSLADFQLLDSKDVQFGGLKAKQMLYTYKSEDFPKPLKVLGYVVAHEADIYLVSCTDSEGDFADNLPIFEAVVKTFEFTK